MNYREAIKYVAMNCSRQEIIRWKMGDIIPRRKHRKGRTPGMTGEEALRGKEKRKKEEDDDKEKDKREMEDEEDTKWEMMRRDMMKEEKKKVIRKVVEIGVRTAMHNNIYKYGGIVWVQAEGGAIGLWLTGVVAKVATRWEREFKKKVDEN